MSRPEVDNVEFIVISAECNACGWSEVTSFRSTNEPHMDEMTRSAKDDLTMMHKADSPECNAQISFS
jgi:hypothetical protein